MLTEALVLPHCYIMPMGNIEIFFYDFHENTPKALNHTQSPIVNMEKQISTSWLYNAHIHSLFTQKHII
jgi:hypothetical protein